MTSLDPAAFIYRRMLLRCRRAFSLVEVVVAAFVFAVGVLALEATAVSSLRQMRRSGRMGLAASVAKSRLEMLAASRCADLLAGTDTVGGIVSAWNVAPAASHGASVVSQAVSYTLDGATRTDSYRAVVPCSR